MATKSEGFEHQIEQCDIGQLFEEFRAIPFNRLTVEIRRYRAKQVRALLSDPGQVDLTIFDREVWPLGHARVNGEDVEAIMRDETRSVDDRVEEVTSALKAGTLELHGNGVWRPAGGIFGAQLGAYERRREALRQGLEILNDASLSPIQKVERLIRDVRGFGRNLATGLAMLFHPDSVALYNGPSEEAMKKLGFKANNLTTFEAEASELKEKLGAEDFLQLDSFLYQLLDTAKPAGQEKVSYWWVNQGNSYERERAGGYLWAGKRAADGRTQQHHLNMTRLNPGSVVVHYANGAIRAVSRVTSKAQDGPRPNASSSTDEDGYLVRTEYHELASPVLLEAIPPDWRTPSVGPFAQQGRVKQGYLYPLSETFVEELASRFPEASDAGLVITSHTQPQPEPNVWIFQANPRAFNLAREIRNYYVGQDDVWAVSRFGSAMRPGDIVLLWQGGAESGIYAIGELTGTVRERTGQEIEASHLPSEHPAASKPVVPFRYTRILAKPLLKTALQNDPRLSSLSILRAPQGTNFRVTPEEWTVLRELLESDDSQAPSNLPQPPYSLEQCAADTGLELQVLERWIWAINQKGQAILYGPPGTGKTFVAQHLAHHLVAGGHGFFETVQFHPAYSYEDFIEGIRPETRDGSLRYPLVPGRFLQFCQRAREKPGDTAVLIIDEINRANLSEVFGELMYLLEYRKEGIELAAGERFQVPENVRIIGTMNTADRSIALVDFALRRRFAFFRLDPNFDLLRRYHQDSDFSVEGLINILRGLNNEIGDPNYAIGVSFFLTHHLAEHVEDIWRMEIYPYVEEYFFDQPDKARRYAWDEVAQAILG